MANVTFRNVSAYVAGDASSRMGVIALAEWWGINRQFKALCDRFANEGFLVVCPDLYHGKGLRTFRIWQLLILIFNVVAKDASEANHLMEGLDFQAAVDECDTWLDYLRTEKGITHVGVTGTCMGKFISFSFSLTYFVFI
jgi:carboxymethylenebutenolidase